MENNRSVQTVEWLSRLSGELAERQREGLLRTLVPRPSDSELEDLANNDYLRLAGHPEVVEAAIEATRRWGCSASASPLITGYTAVHHALAERIANWMDAPACLLWNSGFAANQAILSMLAGPGDRILADRLIHRSMITGILRSGARFQRYRHLDLDHLEHLLAEGGRGRCLVVTETVFSMDGDYPDLQAMVELRERYGFFWVVDEAHALGWYGRRGAGLLEAAGVLDQADVVVGTLGKALGASGAFTVFRDPILRDWLVNHAGELIYSTFFPPASAAAALRAIDLVEAMEEERPIWQARSRAFRQALPGVAEGDSPIVPIPCPGNHAVVTAAERLRCRGWRVAAVRPPTVPPDGARLRVSLHRDLNDSRLESLAGDLKECLAGVEEKTPAKARRSSMRSNERSATEPCLWVGGWAVPPGWAKERVRERWPEASVEWWIPDPEGFADRLRHHVTSTRPSRIRGYSLGAHLLLRLLVEDPFPLPPLTLYAPFLDLRAEADRGGLVPTTQIRYLRRWLGKSPGPAIQDFFQRTGLGAPLPEADEYPGDALDRGLEVLAETGLDRWPALPAGSRLIFGRSDPLVKPWEGPAQPGVSVATVEAGHALESLIQAPDGEPGLDRDAAGGGGSR